MTTLKEQLPLRTPEYFHGGENFEEYLQVCGEVLEEFKDSIRAFDFYKDYKLSAEKRLGLIARRFAFDLPTQVNESTLRGIIRDINSIYSTSGIKKTIQWVMKILSWDAEIEEQWLIFPEKYQEKIRDVYPDFYVDEDLDSQLSAATGVFTPYIGQTYRIGIQYQSYYEDSERVDDGDLVIGQNSLLPIGTFTSTDPFDPDAGFAAHFDVDRITDNNFVTGTPVTKSTGVYFQGRTAFSSEDNLFDLRILGEKYPVEHIRKRQKVMKTPYLAVSIKSDDYDQFIDGENYTDTEKYRIAQYLINFLLYDLFRPVNVKYINLLAPVDQEDFVDVQELHYDEIEFASNPFVTSNKYYFSDAPSYQHYDANMAITTPDYDGDGPSLTFDFVNQDFSVYIPVAFQSKEQYNYSYGSLTWVADGADYVSTEVMQLRTPSSVTITTNQTVDLEYKQYVDSPWIKHTTLTNGTTTTYEIHDVYELRIKNDVNNATVSADITWLDQSSVELALPLTPTFIEQ